MGIIKSWKKPKLDKIQVNVKLDRNKYNAVLENGIVEGIYVTYNTYINHLIDKDLKERKITYE